MSCPTSPLSSPDAEIQARLLDPAKGLRAHVYLELVASVAHMAGLDVTRTLPGRLVFYRCHPGPCEHTIKDRGWVCMNCGMHPACAGDGTCLVSAGCAPCNPSYDEPEPA